MTTTEGMHMDDESKGSGADIGLRDKLADHIRRLEMTGGEFDARKRVADAILADPQKHVDVLVAAGVLECDTFCDTHGRLAFNRDRSEGPCRMCGGDHVGIYRVVGPHVHDWRVVGANAGSDTVMVTCEGCNSFRDDVPNKLPIEIPDA